MNVIYQLVHAVNALLNFGYTYRCNKNYMSVMDVIHGVSSCHRCKK
jgi:hypothetical protein